jgi:hypothetical protein
VVSTPAVDDFTRTSGCAASRNHAFDLVYQSLHFGEVLPGGIYYQLVESEFLHPDGELRQSGCHLGRSVQAHDAAERLVESPKFPAKVLECLEQRGEFSRVELSSLEGKPAITAQRGAPERCPAHPTDEDGRTVRLGRSRLED